MKLEKLVKQSLKCKKNVSLIMSLKPIKLGITTKQPTQKHNYNIYIQMYLQLYTQKTDQT